ncbi:MAG: HNH endonuclease [Candidatus Omnitrophica bacterium]|nr:HNH endonuclease [Candidatus Omnitrophota bacterium]
MFYDASSLADDLAPEEAPTDYHFRTYNLNKYLWGHRTDDIGHQCQYANYLGVPVRDLHYEEDYILVGTFVPSGPIEDKRNLPEYRDWRSKVFKRDNYTCQSCGSKTKLQAHHIKQVILYPELIYDVDNGQTLCKDCHGEVPVLHRGE